MLCRKPPFIGAQPLFASLTLGFPKGLTQSQWPDGLYRKPPFIVAQPLCASFFLCFPQLWHSLGGLMLFAGRCRFLVPRFFLLTFS